MRSLLSEEFRWKGKLKGVKEGVAALQSSKNKVAFDSLKTTAQALHFAKTSLTSELDWKFAQIMFGITTSYRRESDGTLSVKLEGELNDVPLFEQVRIRQSTFWGRTASLCVTELSLTRPQTTTTTFGISSPSSAKLTFTIFGPHS